VESYTVVWSPSMQAEAERKAQRPAPQLPVDRRGHVGNKGHIVLQGERHSVREDPPVTKLRVDWMGEEKLQA
jgi:hypothetical protein